MNVKYIDITTLDHKQDAADLPQDKLLRLVENQLGSNHSSVILDKFISSTRLLDTLKGLTFSTSNTYYTTMDNVVKFPTSGVVVIAGRPAHGKSSLMRNIALRKALKKEKVVYITYEFSQEEEVINFANLYAGDRPTHKEILSGKSEAFNVISSLLNVNLFITHELKTIEDIRSVLNTKELKDATVFIDYIQKVPSSHVRGEVAGSESQIRYVCNVLNDIAITNNMLIITGSQLTRGPDGNPLLDYVKGAKAIEEVASVLLRVWRHNVSESTIIYDELFKCNGSDFTLDILKNRRGLSGTRIGLYTYNGVILKDKTERESGSMFLLNNNSSNEEESET